MSDKCFIVMINVMLYIPKVGDYLKILIDEKVKNFVAIKFNKYFKTKREERKS